MVISIPNTKGELAKVLTYMAENDFYILGINLEDKTLLHTILWYRIWNK